MKELLDVVNEMDEVVEKVAFEEVYKKQLVHRIVHILIFNPKGQLALQLRSKHKRKYPLMWSTSVGGHVQAGETYEQAAFREYEEELGTKSPLTFAYKDWYKDYLGHLKSLVTFKTEYNGPFMINEEEVLRVEFFDLKTIQSMLKNGEKFHPELIFLLKKYYHFKTPLMV